jgi:uncharacterized membrane protein
MRSPLSGIFWKIVLLLVATGMITGMFNGWFIVATIMSIVAVLWVFNSIEAGVMDNANKKLTSSNGRKRGKRCC